MTDKKLGYTIMKVSEFARKFNIRQDQVYRLLRNNGLPKITIGKRKYRVIVKLEWIEVLSSEDEQLMTVQEASNKTGIPEQGIMNAIRSKKISGYLNGLTYRIGKKGLKQLQQMIGDVSEIDDNGKYGTIRL